MASDAGAPQGLEGAGQCFVCVKKSQIRGGFEMDSEKCGVMEVGTELVALETRRNDKGILRVSCAQGWVSEYAGNGAVCLQAQAEPFLTQTLHNPTQRTIKVLSGGCIADAMKISGWSLLDLKRT